MPSDAAMRAAKALKHEVTLMGYIMTIGQEEKVAEIIDREFGTGVPIGRDLKAKIVTCMNFRAWPAYPNICHACGKPESEHPQVASVGPVDADLGKAGTGA